MRLTLTTLLLIMLSMAQTAWGQETRPATKEDAQTALTNIRKAGNGVGTIVATYAMTRRAPLMADLIRDRGTFCYSAAKGGIALTSTDKTGERTVMTRDVFISESEGHTTRLSAQKNPVMSQMLSLISGCLSGDFEGLEKQGTLTYSKGKETFVVTFVPTGKRVARMLKEIRLTFSTKDYSLASLRMTQSETEYTEYTFADKKYNTEVDENLFK